MARYPRGEWRPLPEATQEPLIKTTQVILHSAVSNASSLYPYFSRSDVVLESHFYVNRAGRVEQYIDTSRQADANRTANVRAVSIETWDGGDPDRTPWNASQLESLSRLVAWLCDEHEIPAKRCESHSSPGIGWHTMWGAPSPWTPVSKTCPGKARIPQVPGIIRRVQELLRGDDVMELAEIAKGVELAVKDGGVARDDVKTLVIGAVLDGIREPSKEHPDRGALRGEMIELIQEAMKPLLPPPSS